MPKRVERMLIAIKHSVATSWFSSLRLYYDARTNIHQMLINKFHMKEWKIKHTSACSVSNSNVITYTKVNKTGNVRIA